MPRFSIVIPARNRHHTLAYTLKTCLACEYDNYEIIVYDNASIPPLEVPSGVTLYRGEKALSVTRSWNEAVLRATGEYIILFGNDDGIIPYALRDLDTILTTMGNPPLLRWRRCYYTWANADMIGLPHQRGILQLSIGGTPRILNSKKLISAAVQLKIDYTYLPMLYTATIRRDLVEELYERTGYVFHSLAPDLFSGFAFAAMVDKVPSITKPMTINAGSNESTGVNVLAFGKTGKESELHKEFIRLNYQDGLIPANHMTKQELTRQAEFERCFRIIGELGLIDHDPVPFSDVPEFDGTIEEVYANDVFEASQICGERLDTPYSLEFVEW